MAVKLSKITAV
uniref:Uncharacterized protein n=1 Tax=Anguilla anguilla TaxID=7936 RepID=A0A0E9Y0E9_ANGAN